MTDKPVYKKGEVLRASVYLYDKFSKKPVKPAKPASPRSSRFHPWPLPPEPPPWRWRI